MNERDKRLAVDGATRLREFRAGTIGLGELIADLDTIISTLEAADPALLAALRQNWGKLEDAYAVALYREKSVAELGSDRAVIAALRELDHLFAGTR